VKTNGTLIDLTHPLDGDAIYWPGDPKFHIEKEYEGMLKPGTYYSANRFSMGEHVGTHVDAPRHMHRDGCTIDGIPLHSLIGPGVRIDASERIAGRPERSVAMEDLARWESRNGPIAAGSIVLLFTGFSRLLPDRARYLGTTETGAAGLDRLRFPGLDAEAAEWLAETRGIRSVGIDTAGIDPGDSRSFDAHKTLFQRGIPVFENVANLESLPDAGFTVIALPLPIRGGSGAPLRIVAVVP